ncbi:MAG: hypothetical protein K9G49_04860 [Taibaiella sp.]|nr:hypothetical protein [Taibaiella sp.]
MEGKFGVLFFRCNQLLIMKKVEALHAIRLRKSEFYNFAMEQKNEQIDSNVFDF